MNDRSGRLLSWSSWLLAAFIPLPLAAGLIDPREPTHWMALGLIWALAHAALEPEEFRRRFVPDASPLALAGIRIWVCLALLYCTLRSDLPGTSRLPREMLEVSPDRMEMLLRLPGFSGLLTNENALAAFWALTALALTAGAVGFLTRVTLPLATLCSFLQISIFTNYTYFFHQWLIGMYVLTAVALTPCGDVLSVDAWLRKRRGQEPVERPAAVYAWSRYLCWVALALPYFFAGLSKLRNGGWMWWEPMNLRGKVYRDSLQKGVLEAPLGPAFFDAPDWAFGAIGLATLVLEIGFVLVLFSRRARRILPPGAVSMHLGILVLQNFIFLDALLMQAIFFDWKRLGGWVRKRASMLVEARPAIAAAKPAYASLVSGAAMVIGLVWLLRIESYPLSSWGMYSGTRLDSSTIYHLAWAEHATRGRIPAPYERCFPAPAFNPYVRMEGYAFRDPQRQEASRKFFLACAAELNRGKPPQERIAGFIIEQWHWNWEESPGGPPHGALLDSREVVAAMEEVR